MNLREKLIEAGARDYRKEDREYWLGVMENALDAFLGSIAEHPDEFSEAGVRYVCQDKLIAALRDTDTGPS